MKNFAQKVLINYALVVIVLAVVNISAFGFSEYARFSLELLAVLVVVWLALMLTNMFQSRWPVLEYLLELATVLAIVLGGGWLFGWYDTHWISHMIAVIVAVYAGVYAVGADRARRDAQFINEQIKLRRGNGNKEGAEQ